jgi:anti-anti-sigma factor
MAMTIDRPSTGPLFPDAVCVADDDGFRIELTGEIDFATRPKLAEVLAQITAVPSAPVLVDLSGVTFLSSDGLGFLSQLRHHATTGGHEVTLHRPGRVALRALEVIGFDLVFPITGVERPDDRESPSELA